MQEDIKKLLEQVLANQVVLYKLLNDDILAKYKSRSNETIAKALQAEAEKYLPHIKAKD